MNKIETNMNMKTITITNDFICYQQGGIGKEIIIAIEEMKQENKQLKEAIETLKETNKLLLQQKGQLQEDLDMLDSRIDKAIEYFKQPAYKGYLLASLGTHYFKLLEILKGE